MSILKEIQEAVMNKKVPVIRTGQTVRVFQKIKEGEKERIQMFEGLVIKVNSGLGADRSFTVRKVVEGIGVEKIYPLYSPRIDKIEVKKEAKVRRAKLYYMRDRSGKSARLKESFVQNAEWEPVIEHAVKAADAPVEEAEAMETPEVTVEAVETAETPETAAVEEAAPAEEAPAEEAAAEEAPAAEEDSKKE